ncbi:hypothetical protein [Clostridium guangxiense]|uniref:hypothetical protein n=1 Tax=Clostridium guangxiense TaxID=1662055 RepID=UPI001E64681E|nr:hypothetical protein [Clostridium guangxiense]MCD2347573.1 hypothetical protein [Clostridium guangxiense]
MLKKNIKIIGALTALNILISLNVGYKSTYASSAKSTTSISGTTIMNKNHKHHDYKSRLDKLANDNVINKKQEDAVLNLIKSDEFHQSMKKNHKCSKNKLNALVENRTITKTQESYIKQAFLASKKSGKNFKISFNNELDTLVNKKIINKNQKTAVQNLFDSCKKERISNLNVLFKRKFDVLVNNGTITQKQEEAIIRGLLNSKYNS